MVVSTCSDVRVFTAFTKVLEVASNPGHREGRVRDRLRHRLGHDLNRGVHGAHEGRAT